MIDSEETLFSFRSEKTLGDSEGGGSTAGRDRSRQIWGCVQRTLQGAGGSGCSRHRCLSRQCCPLIKKMVVVLTMMIICLEQEYLDDNNVDVFSVLSQSVQLCHLLMMFIQDVKMWIVANLDDLCIGH